MIRFRVIAPCLLALGLLGFVNPAQAISCWAVTGWSPSSGSHQQALLSATSCNTTPAGTAWVQVTQTYGTPLPDTTWLRLALTDSHVSGGKFSPLLVYSHTWGGVPVIYTDIIPCTSCQNYHWLTSAPPQYVPKAGDRVRLRHDLTWQCLYTPGPNGMQVRSARCGADPALTFVLDAAAGGTFRLRNEGTGQCLYAVNTNGAPLYSWGCWDDPNMRFQLVPVGQGFRLEHTKNSPRQCPYVYANNGLAYTWSCWNDPAMVFYLDPV